MQFGRDQVCDVRGEPWCGPWIAEGFHGGRTSSRRSCRTATGGPLAAATPATQARRCSSVGCGNRGQGFKHPKRTKAYRIVDGGLLIPRGQPGGDGVDDLPVIAGYHEDWEPFSLLLVRAPEFLDTGVVVPASQLRIEIEQNF